LALPARRLISVLYCMLVDQPVFTEEAEKHRQDIIIALEWPEVGEQMQLEADDKQARAALAQFGISLPIGIEFVPE